MTKIVIGGQSRKVGKTAVGACLIRAFPQYSWTAAKISSHRSSAPEGACVIRAEINRSGKSDTSRYLAAGAARSFWIQVRDGGWENAFPHICQILGSDGNVLIESNGILRYMRPDMCLVVLHYDVADVKESLGEALSHADALLGVGSGVETPAWRDLADRFAPGVPLFRTSDPSSIPPELLEFVKARL